MTLITAKNSPPLDNFEIHPILPNVVPANENLLANMVRQTPQIRALIQDCDVVHSTIEMYGIVRLLAVGHHAQYIITAHGTYANLPLMRRFPANVLYRQSFTHSKMVCVSHYTEKVVKRVAPHAQTVVIPNAVNAARFANLPVYPKTGRIILTNGGIKGRKGTLELVQAVAKVRETLPDVKCIVLGRSFEEAYQREVLAEIERLNLRETVELRGFVSDEELLQCYAQADVFVLPSINRGYHFEGFGLVHLEASAAGLPVIGTSDCGAEEAIDEGVTGFLVNQARVNAELPLAILDILQNPQKAQQMGNAGKLKAQAQTWDNVAHELLRVYGWQN